MITKVPNGWRVDVQPGGRGRKRYRKTFPRKADAVAWELSVKSAKADDPSYDPPKKDSRRLLDLVNLWFDLHGLNLKSSSDTLRRLQTLCESVGNPFAVAFTSADFAVYRARRLGEGVKAATLNRERVSLSAVFSELKRLGHWSLANPLAGVRPLKVDNFELSYLSLGQIDVLFDELAKSGNADVWLVARLAISTGARWSEVEGLRLSDIRLDLGQVAYHRTKNGRSRYVPVEAGLLCQVYERLKLGPFKRSYYAFRPAVVRAGLDLPDGQLVHVLRHTFASHFVQRGGNIIALQQILGHSSIEVTMRYAHLAPSFLDQAKILNPLAR